MPGTDSSEDNDVGREERDIYLVVLGAMVPIVLATALTRGVFNGGATICLILLTLAILGLFATLIVRRRQRAAAIPQARTRARR